MKVVAIDCSPRKDGNTAILLERAMAPKAAAGIETELIQTAGKKIQGCIACGKCVELKDGKCHGRSDFGNECIDAVAAADGVLIGSPVYFADITAEAKALIDRLGYVAGGAPEILDRKVGAGVIAMRRAGSVHALDSINHLFLIRRMIVPGSSYWNVGIGGLKGSVTEDEEGMRTMDVLGEQMAWLLGKLNA